MALAIIRAIEAHREHIDIEFDIGSVNQFFAYAIGLDQRRFHGIPRVSDIVLQSALLGPVNGLSGSPLGRVTIVISHRELDSALQKKKRHGTVALDAVYLQLVSFVDKQGAGIAISDVFDISSFIRNALPSPAYFNHRARTHVMSLSNTAFVYQNPARGFHYSQGFMAPAALLAALPALMPLLRQVLNPQTIQTVLDAPIRQSQAVFNGLKELSRLGIESHEQDLRHLRELNPGVDDAALNQLLASMSYGADISSGGVQYKRVASVRLAMVETEFMMINGQKKMMYAQAATAVFPMQVESPRSIAQALVEIEMLDAKTGASVLFRRQKIGPVFNSVIRPSLSIQDLQGLQVPNEYLLVLRVVWRNRHGQWRGNSIQQVITLCGVSLYDRMLEAGERIALDNQQEFASYWQKIWSNTATTENKRAEFQIRYYLALKNEAQQNTPLRAQFRRTSQNNEMLEGKIRAGMDFSLSLLASLGRRLSGAIITADDIEALKHPEFMRRFTMASEYRAKFRARADDRMQFWVYPEMQLQKINIKVISKTNANGMIIAFSDRVIQMPIPSALYFVGQRIRNETEELFHDKMGLFPVELQDLELSTHVNNENHALGFRALNTSIKRVHQKRKEPILLRRLQARSLSRSKKFTRRSTKLTRGHINGSGYAQQYYSVGSGAQKAKSTGRLRQRLQRARVTHVTS